MYFHGYFFRFGLQPLQQRVNDEVLCPPERESLFAISGELAVLMLPSLLVLFYQLAEILLW
jgi:hypothetical protein